MCECERMYVYRSVVLKSIFTNPEYNVLITWYLNLYSSVALFWKMHILQTQAYEILLADLQTLTYNIILSDTRCHACKLYYYTGGCVSVRGCIGQYKVLDIANILNNIFAIYCPFSGLKKIQSPHPIYLQYKILYISNIADNIKYWILQIYWTIYLQYIVPFQGWKKFKVHVQYICNIRYFILQI